MRPSILAVVVLFASLSFANTPQAGQTFAYQNGGFNLVLLTPEGNPLLGPTVYSSSIADLDFITFVNGCSCLTTWIFNMTIAGLGTFTTSQSAFLGSGLQGFGGDFNLIPPNFAYKPVQGALSFTVNSVQSGPYLFQYMRPVAEPGTLILLGTGFLGLGLILRRRWRGEYTRSQPPHIESSGVSSPPKGSNVTTMVETSTGVSLLHIDRDCA
jgi:PEP-CTERM motif